MLTDDDLAGSVKGVMRNALFDSAKLQDKDTMPPASEICNTKWKTQCPRAFARVHAPLVQAMVQGLPMSRLWPCKLVCRGMVLRKETALLLVVDALEYVVKCVRLVSKTIKTKAGDLKMMCPARHLIQ